MSGDTVINEIEGCSGVNTKVFVYVRCMPFRVSIRCYASCV